MIAIKLTYDKTVYHLKFHMQIIIIFNTKVAD